MGFEQRGEGVDVGFCGGGGGEGGAALGGGAVGFVEGEDVGYVVVATAGGEEGGGLVDPGGVGGDAEEHGHEV